MSEDIASNIELMPIIIGVVVSIILVGIGLVSSVGAIGMIGIILGGAISGFLTNNSTSYAIIYGAVVGLITSFLILYSFFAIPFCMILGIFGGFVGIVAQKNLK